MTTFRKARATLGALGLNCFRLGGKIIVADHFGARTEVETPDEAVDAGWLALREFLDRGVSYEH